MSVMTTQMGRRGHPEARNPFPLEEQVPAMLAEDPMVRAFLAGLDEVWAPIVLTLDCFYAYLDPRTAPLDMVAYLGSWIRADTVDAWTESSVRDDVAHAHSLFAMAGTARAIRERLVPREAESVVIEDSGTTLISTMPTNPHDWNDSVRPVSITVRALPGSTEAMKDRIRSIISDLTPAHVVLDVVIL